MSKWQKTEWEEFVELCEKRGKVATEILDEADYNLDECPFCQKFQPLSRHETEGHCWFCEQFLLSEEDLND